MQDEDEVCRDVLQIVSLVGDKWSLPVLGQLRGGRRRFGELQRAVPGISQRMLTVTVRKLERDGLVSRHVHASVPPQVAYELTGIGRSLLVATLGLGEWAVENRVAIAAHRHRFAAN
ncbi:DNA-binding transcriptional regulator, HxlR family [Saccharopolyspora antimicrobica]|uniref:DNA-binding transcriptional regulator, HxlR family n=1 Tax=Saccharopolyspora antimicrobica TaxID=455193 RepID=A0A1I5M7U4_9PSEU|nr:helix-turn-helix domain-containing protein [Saccharopolyspora antimicrobica]RKT82079.1 HxlR family transcriptional regulator [Saccharopolyspora antimicrobica]SFP05387.1 DNA-binding transcriptional regulator, HxlR family [Saccharopolyspora antimicrobica]